MKESRPFYWSVLTPNTTMLLSEPEMFSPHGLWTACASAHLDIAQMPWYSLVVHEVHADRVKSIHDTVHMMTRSPDFQMEQIAP